MNLNKYIASSGLCSRRGADLLIKNGKVKVNGRAAKPTDKINDSDRVHVSDKLVKPIEKKTYVVLNKPVGIICTTDKNAPDNIMSLIKISDRVFPIGRLDVKSEGLILLTNDGDFAQKVLKSKKVEKEYIVDTNKAIHDEFLNKLEKGMIIDGFPTLPAKTRKIADRRFSIVLREGRKRQVRRMCEKLKVEVRKLRRVRIGEITLENLKEREYKLISEREIKERIKI